MGGLDGLDLDLQDELLHDDSVSLFFYFILLLSAASGWTPEERTARVCIMEKRKDLPLALSHVSIFFSSSSSSSSSTPSILVLHST